MKIIKNEIMLGDCFIAIEKDYDYWLASVKRYEELKSQGRLF